jgi:hypothetical protein
VAALFSTTPVMFRSMTSTNTSAARSRKTSAASMPSIMFEVRGTLFPIGETDRFEPARLLDDGRLVGYQDRRPLGNSLTQLHSTLRMDYWQRIVILCR